MSSSSSSTSTFALIAVSLVVAVGLPCLLYPTQTLRWIRRKNYQYEVTMSLYMFGSREKYMINSMFFLIFSLIFIASALYLPSHLAIISNRAVYYYTGSVVDVAATAARNSSRDFLMSLAGYGPSAESNGVANAEGRRESPAVASSSSSSSSSSAVTASANIDNPATSSKFAQAVEDAERRMTAGSN